MRDDDATGCQHILDHAQAERKPEIEPNGVGNHFRWKPVATIERITCRSGHADRSHIFIASRLTLRCPSGCSQDEVNAAIGRLTLQALKQLDATAADLQLDRKAAEFLDSISPRDSLCASGGPNCSYFHAYGSEYRDATINSQYFQDVVSLYCWFSRGTEPVFPPRSEPPLSMVF